MFKRIKMLRRVELFLFKRLQRSPDVQKVLIAEKIFLIPLDTT
jgi:hypothetical protein